MVKFSSRGSELRLSALNHFHPEESPQGALTAVGYITSKPILDVGVTGGGREHPGPVSCASFLIIAQQLLFVYLPS